MYVSLKWVEQLLQIPTLSLKFLVDRLVLAGFEIENIDEKFLGTQRSDIILDVSLTANRADSSNIKGFTNELISLVFADLIFQKIVQLKPLFLLPSIKIINRNISSLKFLHKETYHISPKILIKKMEYKNYFHQFLFKYSLWESYKQKQYFRVQKTKENNEIKPNKYNYISLIEHKSNKVSLSESPTWIKKRLLAMSFKPINNVIDTINYILIETGQVFFVYDILALEQFTNTSTIKLTPKFTKKKVDFKISELEILSLKDEILTLMNNNKSIALLGFLQEYNTIVTRKTKQLLLHAILYDSKQIKQMSKVLGLKTEYSMRLENQIDLNLFEQAYFRLLYLFRVQGIYFEISKFQTPAFLTKNQSILFLNYINQTKTKIKIIFKNIYKLIGPSKEFQQLQTGQIFESLRALNIKIIYRTENYFNILVPLHRQNDLKQEVDIIEEISRIIGFDYFPSILPNNNKIKFGKITKLEKFKRQLRTSFLNFGFNESMLSILTKKTKCDEILLKNPLFTDSSILRVSLLNSLLEKVKFNRNIVRENFETFEIGRVYKFFYNKNGGKEELELISGVFGGKLFRSTWESKDSTINWFEAKGLLENIFTKLSLSPNWKVSQFKFPTLFHPTRTTNIFINSKLIGTFGQIHPTLALKEKFNKQTYLFEFNLEDFNEIWITKASIKYKEYSSYPISFIDLTCIAKKNLSFQVIKEEIMIIGRPLLKSIKLFDYYSQPPIKNGYCSLSFKLQFTSQTKTLVNLEVNQIIEKIIYFLEKEFDIEFKY